MDCRICSEIGHMARDCPQKGGGGDRGPMTCYKCKEEGHMSRECPNAAAGGGGDRGPMTCYKCKEEGHMSRECPNAAAGGGGDRGPMICHKCKEEGHMSRDCSNAAAGGGGDRGPMTCYKCKQEGHMARECPEAGEDGGTGRGGCHRCGEEGHMVRDCTKEVENDVGPDGKPRERYTPADFVEGDQVFENRNQAHTGSGINFEKYDTIPIKVTGNNPPKEACSFESMKLRPLLMTNIAKCSYTKPTPIQRWATPILASGRDIMACAQTGSGKTAAFLLPILNNLIQDPDITGTGAAPATPEALILGPTRELVIQIGEEGHAYGMGSIVRTKVVYGGTTSRHQLNQLLNGCNILTATPGRLIQFMNEGHISFAKLKYFILDEADRMLDMGFMGDVRKIVDKLPPKEERVSGMFSATFPPDVQKLASEFLNDYIFVTVGIVGGACTDVDQQFIKLERKEKKNKLFEILKGIQKTEKVLVFCGSKKQADFLATSLAGGKFSSTSIHGDRLQSQREAALKEFTNGTRQILVATAVAARGLDIPKVGLVINYDMPSEIDEYVHRIGRTGRVGNTGRAISFFDSSSDSAIIPKLKEILSGASQTIPEFLDEVPGAAADFGGFDDGFGGVDSRMNDLKVGAVTNGGDGFDEEDW